MIEGDGVSRGHGSSDGVGCGFAGVEVGRDKVVHGELGHRLTAWIPTKWVTDSWQR